MLRFNSVTRRVRDRIGTVTSDHPGFVTARTPIGGERILDLPFGESLPRIC